MEEANKKGQECILFFDELNRAQRDVRQIALQITLEKRLHDHILVN
jgi:MoxR-like ATPase